MCERRVMLRLEVCEGSVRELGVLETGEMSVDRMHTANHVCW